MPISSDAVEEGASFIKSVLVSLLALWSLLSMGSVVLMRLFDTSIVAEEFFGDGGRVKVLSIPYVSPLSSPTIGGETSLELILVIIDDSGEGALFLLFISVGELSKLPPSFNAEDDGLLSSSATVVPIDPFVVTAAVTSMLTVCSWYPRKFSVQTFRSSRHLSWRLNDLSPRNA